MDPITILSVACAAGQFVSFGFDLVKGSVERYRSIEGAEKRHLAMTEDAKRLSDLINALSRESSQSATFTLYQSKSPLALKLDFITYECYAVADELRELVSSTSVQPSEKRRMLQSIKMTIRSVRKDSAITNLHNRLRTLRENVDTCMMMVLW
ncbi:hypothetical protein SEUCBS139899_003422 [Sporothrix eucalyptigena]|uniref:Fungal N-terminal domain-containing protein n=1 Tax=Sporothrix eucalyptigena TaxID=1812306 RepID=A0ABP0C5C2_9PEZI